MGPPRPFEPVVWLLLRDTRCSSLQSGHWLGRQPRGSTWFEAHFLDERPSPCGGADLEGPPFSKTGTCTWSLDLGRDAASERVRSNAQPAQICAIGEVTPCLNKW